MRQLNQYARHSGRSDWPLSYFAYTAGSDDLTIRMSAALRGPLLG